MAHGVRACTRCPARRGSPAPAAGHLWIARRRGVPHRSVAASWPAPVRRPSRRERLAPRCGTGSPRRAARSSAPAPDPRAPRRAWRRTHCPRGRGRHPGDANACRTAPAAMSTYRFPDRLTCRRPAPRHRRRLARTSARPPRLRPSGSRPATYQRCPTAAPGRGCAGCRG